MAIFEYYGAFTPTGIIKHDRITFREYYFLLNVVYLVAPVLPFDNTDIGPHNWVSCYNCGP